MNTNILLLVIISSLESFTSQRTALDNLTPQFYFLQNALLQGFGRISEDPGNLRLAKQLRKTQPQLPEDALFPCSLNNTRSEVPPKSVHALRPGDIDIVAALGDSLTAGNGIVATNAVHAILNNRGISYAAGGQGTWRTYTTIANILKVFNPNLIGYSQKDSYIFQKESEFNVAEAGAMSRDLPHLSKLLVERLKSDKRVDLDKHWKIIYVLIGANDFCADMCYYKNPEVIVENHRRNLLVMLRHLKANLPKTFVNIVSAPDLSVLANFTLSNRPPLCYITHNVLCPCIFGLQFAKLQGRYSSVMKKWQEAEFEVSSNPEFDTEDFTVVFQPIVGYYNIPRFANGLTDYSSLSQDCFHLSQKEIAKASTSIWNNMMEPVGNKSTVISDFFQFKCPTENHPYIFTRRNS